MLHVRPLIHCIGALLSLLPRTANAFEIPGDWADPICAYIPCNGYDGGAAGLSDYLLDKVVTAGEIGFVALAIIMLFSATVNMVIFSEQDDIVKQGRTSFIYTIVGAAVVAFARWFAMAFSPTETVGEIVNTAIVNDVVANVVTFFRLLLAIMLTVNIAIQGMRLVASQGGQEQTERARKRLIQGFIGVAIVILANTIAVAVNPRLGSTTQLAIEIAGIANYLITILGFAAVLAIVIAGILLVVSVDESLKDKAKNLVKVAVIALVVVLAAYALVTAFIHIV